MCRSILPSVSSPRLSKNADGVAGLTELKVAQFREKMLSQGIVATYTGVRGSKDSLFEKVSVSSVV